MSRAEEEHRGSELRREPRSMRQRANMLERLRRELEQSISAEEDEYARTAHWVTRDTFRGTASQGRPSGAIASVAPQPTLEQWQAMVTAGEPGAAAEAQAAAHPRRARGSRRHAGRD